MLILIFKLPLRDSTHPNLPSEGKELFFLPCEGGLKVGADFCYHVSLTGCHPSLSLSQNVTFSHLLFGRVLSQGKGRKNLLPNEGGEKVGADFCYHVSLTGCQPIPPHTFLIREGNNLTFLNKKVNFGLKKYFI